MTGITKDLAREYRETMDKDVLHSWAKDAVAQLALLPELIEALEDLAKSCDFFGPGRHGRVDDRTIIRARSILARLGGV